MNNYSDFWVRESNPYVYTNDAMMYHPAVDNMGGYATNKANVNNQLYQASEGYMKGNLFRNLYNPYMNYVPAQLVARNEREELLLNLNKMQFCAHELSLVLDIDPNNSNILNDFNKYKNEYDRLLKEYESKYEAINIDSNNKDNSSYGWGEERWPWEGEMQ